MNLVKPEIENTTPSAIGANFVPKTTWNFLCDDEFDKKAYLVTQKIGVAFKGVA